MNGQQLKSLIERGSYHPQPERVAQAMLSRRGIRELLVGGAALSPAGRIHPAQEHPRQAA
jgi:Anti-sigma-28 factor, FlgM